MANYHLRVKNDTKPKGGKVSAKRHADYILREDAKAHADYINSEGAQSEKIDCVPNELTLEQNCRFFHC